MNFRRPLPEIRWQPRLSPVLRKPGTLSKMPIGVRAAKRGLPPIPAFGIGWLYPVCPVPGLPRRRNSPAAKIFDGSDRSFFSETCQAFTRLLLWMKSAESNDPNSGRRHQTKFSGSLRLCKVRVSL